MREVAPRPQPGSGRPAGAIKGALPPYDSSRRFTSNEAPRHVRDGTQADLPQARSGSAIEADRPVTRGLGGGIHPPEPRPGRGATRGGGGRPRIRTPGTRCWPSSAGVLVDTNIFVYA